MTNNLVLCRASAKTLANMSLEDLRKELIAGVQFTAKSLTYLAMVWAELERRGCDLSKMRKGIVAYLPLIAKGNVSAETVVAFSGQMKLLKAVSKLPMAEQRRLTEGGKVSVACGAKIKEIEPVSLSAVEVSQVFCDDGRIRTVQEQRQWRNFRQDASPPTLPIRQKTIAIPLSQTEYGLLQRLSAEQDVPLYKLAHRALMEGLKKCT